MDDEIIEQLKACAKCGDSLPVSRFYRDRTKPGGVARRCKKCHHVYQSRKRKPQVERFWGYVRKTEHCWEWIACRGDDGYGQFGFNGRVVRAHKVSYILTFGPIPDGLFVLHHCDNPPCVRPDHLFLGTNQDNMDDMIRKGRKVICRGAQTGRATLNEEMVVLMRRMHSQGANFTSIGRSVGVHKSTARMAVTGRSWKHVD